MLREIIRLGWPVFIAQAAVVANGIIDTVMAGRYGTVDLAAVGIGASVYATLFITLLGVLFALTPIAAQLYGAGRHEAIGEEVRQSAWLALGIGSLAILLLLFPGPLLALSRLTPEVEAKTRAYLSATAWGVPAALLLRVFQGFTTSVSRPRLMMVFNLVGLALKVPLNWIFMYGAFGAPTLGGPGCAVATSLIYCVSAALAWGWCYREPGFQRFGIFARWSWPRGRAQWQLLALGVPIGAVFLVDVTAFTFMALFIARLGVLYSGAHQIAANIAALCFMLPLAVGNASGVLVGQAIGAQQFERARHIAHVGIAFGLALGLTVGGTIFILADAIVALYTRDVEVRRIAAGLLALVAAYHVFDALQIVAVNLLRAYKRTAIPMFLYAIALWGLGLGGGYVLGIGPWDLSTLGITGRLGARGFWLAAIAGMAVTGCLATLYLLRVNRTELPR